MLSSDWVAVLTGMVICCGLPFDEAVTVGAGLKSCWMESAEDIAGRFRSDPSVMFNETDPVLSQPEVPFEQLEVRTSWFAPVPVAEKVPCG